MIQARRLAGYALTLSLLAVATAVALPLLTGRPVISYASSGSMEPTIGVLDAFLVHPFPRHLEHGDVVVFDSVREGGRAVHRIVGGDESGWYTQGDANPNVDQDAGEPLLTSDRVLGRVVTRPDGAPLVFDDLGVPFVEARIEVAKVEKYVGGPRQLLAMALFGVAVLSAAAGMLGGSRARLPARRSRRAQALLRRVFPRGVRGRHLGVALLALLVFSTIWAAVYSRDELSVQLVVVNDPHAADGARAGAPGDALARDLRIGALGVIPTLAILEGSDRVIAPEGATRLGPLATTVLTVQEIAGDDVGLQEDRVQVWRYPAMFPSNAILAMHEAMPGLPYVAFGIVVALVGSLWFTAFGFARMPVGRMIGIREDWR